MKLAAWSMYRNLSTLSTRSNRMVPRSSGSRRRNLRQQTLPLAVNPLPSPKIEASPSAAPQPRRHSCLTQDAELRLYQPQVRRHRAHAGNPYWYRRVNSTSSLPLPRVRQIVHQDECEWPPSINIPCKNSRLGHILETRIWHR